MADFSIQYEGTKFSLDTYNENQQLLSYEFLIRQEVGDPKWKWIYLPYGKKSIKVKNWIIPCEPVPSFNTENGIELSFVAILDGKNYKIKVLGNHPNKYFTDSFVAKVFKKTIECIVDNTLNTIEGNTQTINFSYKEVYEKDNNDIELQMTSKPE